MAIRFFQQRGIQVFLLVALYLCVASFLPLSTHQALYTISLLMKDLLLWLLPLTVCFFIAHAISSFEKQAPWFIVTLLLFEALSNSASVWFAYGWGHVVTQALHIDTPQTVSASLDPLWRLPLTKPLWWSAQKGTLAGILLGLLAAFRFPTLRKWIDRGKEGAQFVLTRLFSRLIPLFILGFVARMVQTHLLEQMGGQYADFLLWLLVVLISYIFLLFLVGSRFSFRECFQSIKNLLPAAGVAFSSGCSLSTMPWTIEGCGKNLDQPDFAKAIIPATTNVQQIGDCIANTFLCFFLYTQFHGHPPPLSVWLPFTGVFVMARFATAAVLGGAIFLMIPIYETYLGFNAEMIAIILAFNVLLDPLITCSNVVANGALCRLFERTWMWVQKKLTFT